MSFTIRRLALLLLVTSGAAGCLGLGPSAISRDRFDYNTAVAESQKQQTLLNIVKLRYLDSPVFLDVGQIVGGYTMMSTFQASGNMFSFNAPSGFNPAGVPSSSVGLGAQGQFTERPTITFTPLTGAQFAKSILTPIPPSAILFLLQAGWPADVLLSLTVDSINGLQNRVGAPARRQEGDPEFQRLLQFLRQVQRANAVSLRIHPGQQKDERTLMIFRRQAVAAEVSAATREIRGLLGLDPDGTEFRVVYGSVSAAKDEVAMLTRSMVQILIELAALIDVPTGHVEEGRVPPTLPAADGVAPLIRIRSGAVQPADAFASVKYRNSWYWVDDADLRSKGTFSFIMMLFSLSDTGGKESLPLVTIPAQ